MKPAAGSKKAVLGYDYLGRRVEKKVFDWNTSSGAWSASPSVHRRFVWKDWLLLLDDDQLNDPNNPDRTFTWGLDLAGLNGQVNSLDAAGGIGGLVGSTLGAYLYDGNGNVTQLVSGALQTFTGGLPTFNGALLARYEYDAYGNLIGPNDNGGAFDPATDLTATARANPIRFSTKYWDDETGLGYWGYRYYSE